MISMSGKGHCFDNAMVETFFKTLKSELGWRTAFQTRAEAIDAPAVPSMTSTSPAAVTRRLASPAPSCSRRASPDPCPQQKVPMRAEILNLR